MSESCLRLHFLLVLLLSCLSVSSIFFAKYPDFGIVACRPHQIQAFTQFKNEFDTRACNHSDSLNGVRCDNSTGAVTAIRLRTCLSEILKPNSSLFQFHQLRVLDLGQSNFISSSLHSEFGKLNKLEILYLESSGLLGLIPSSFNNLCMLSYLDLSHNKLAGNLRFLRNLSKLTYLRLSSNHFSRTINSNSSLFELHHLRYLDFASNNFTSSSLPYEIGNLNNLEVFSLPSNSFFSQVPPTISNLTLLSELVLANNQFAGSFPLVKNLTKLSLLVLSKNHFSGTIPSYLFTMPFLSKLELLQNNFNGSIEIPNSSSSSRLEYLYLSNNNFEGKILKPISKLINLKELSLCFLNTSYPINLGLFSSLKSLFLLELSGCWISRASLGSDSFIPSTLEALLLENCEISDFPKFLKSLHILEYIGIADNRISGKIPEWLWSLPSLSLVFISRKLLNGFENSSNVLVKSSVRILALDGNNLEGSLPQLPLSINLFEGENNRFNGHIPLSICNRSSLSWLDLSYNNFTGPIPSCLSNLMILKLRKNNLDGSIPDKFYVDAPLRILDIGYNLLTRKLPKSLLNCSLLQFLSVENNIIKDTFPFSLKTLSDFQVLILSSNELYSPISPPNRGMLGFPELRMLEIAGNQLTRSFPPNFFVNWKASSLKMNEDRGLYMVYEKVLYSIYALHSLDFIDLQYKGLSMEQERALTSYAAIDFSGNRLKVPIPESIGLLMEFISLNLSSNAFTCHIPLTLANLMELESLDLSSNRLSGTIPNGLGSLLFLAYVNVSHNQLKGEIPQGTKIMGQPKSSFEGNAGFCGLPLKESCFGTNAPPLAQQPKEEDEEEEQVLNWKAVTIGYGSGVLLGLVIAQVIPSYKPEWLVKIIGRNR